MTPMTEADGHPDVAEISDLTEGLLPSSRSAEVRRHLDDCPLCADVHTSLEEIRGLLGTLPGPARMPDDVARRIDAALAAEALISATAPEQHARQATTDDTEAAADEGPAAPPTENVMPTGRAVDHVSRETSASSARSTGPRRGTAATGPGRKERRRPGRRRVAALGAVFAVAALGLGSVLVSTLTDDDSPGETARPQSTVADTFSANGLEQKVSALLAQAPQPRTLHTLGVEGEEGDAGLASPKTERQPTVPSCVQQGLDRNDAALGVEPGTFRGGPALLVVLPDTSDSTRVTAYLMDATCVDRPSTGPAKVLLKDSYPRS
ncbi:MULTISPECIES: anti-sigma factor family protein [unclassified Streptomyces]|uniref:anti-sigma factor family protein n=1 Tax=unclassified Streptomyces TaxID=2593676 RepID=UPI003803A875